MDKNSIFKMLGATNHSATSRDLNDFYATDPKAIELLLEREQFSTKIWECACGEGHLSKVLERHGYEVLSTDLIDRGYGRGGVDFLKTETKFDGDIVTNPPYKYAKEFVEHGIESVTNGQRVAMFLRLQFLEGQARRQLFDKYPPKYIYVASKRILCAKNGNFDLANSAVAYAWFIWEKSFNGEPTVRWLG